MSKIAEIARMFKHGWTQDSYIKGLAYQRVNGKDHFCFMGFYDSKVPSELRAIAGQPFINRVRAKIREKGYNYTVDGVNYYNYIPGINDSEFGYERLIGIVDEILVEEAQKEAPAPKEVERVLVYA